jgi:hypothetical protein
MDIFPNPAKDMITVETKGIGQFSIFDLTGREVFRKTITEKRTTIDIGSFSCGVYVAKLIGKGEISTLRIIKY